MSLCFLELQSEYVYLLDPSTYKYLSRVGRDKEYIEAVKDGPDPASKFKLVRHDGGQVSLQADTGKYLSRIAYTPDPVDQNFIQPLKDRADAHSLFDVVYDAKGGPWVGAGTITLKADNGHYWAVCPSDGINYIKASGSSPHQVKFIIVVAR